MILTCPACGTQYMVKDGAIPPQGRQVRCASCGNSWHQEPEESAASEDGADTPPAEVWPTEQDPQRSNASESGSAEERQPFEFADEESIDEREENRRADDAAVAAEAATAGFQTGAAAPPADPAVERTVAAPAPPEREESFPDRGTRAERDGNWDEDVSDDFSPFAAREPSSGSKRSGLMILLILLLLVAIAAAAIFSFAPDTWRERFGLQSDEQTQLQLMMTHSDRQALASGNELLAVSGRVINPTERTQPVPPIHAQLHSSSGQLVYSWTIPPPALSLPPGGSASFNSAKLNVPAGGEELTVTLGDASA